jgi:hypothetical protein
VAFCGAAEDGMGFFQIQAVRSNQIVNSSQVSFAALITVEMGEVNAQLIRSELARIIPVRWVWEVQDLGNKSFVVPFLSKEELERMIAMHTITTRNKEGTITFEESVDDVHLRSFLPLWAVGSIMGATQKVDMLHLRTTSQVRILVAVYDAKKNPEVR